MCTENSQRVCNIKRSAEYVYGKCSNDRSRHKRFTEFLRLRKELKRGNFERKLLTDAVMELLNDFPPWDVNEALLRDWILIGLFSLHWVLVNKHWPTHFQTPQVRHKMLVAKTTYNLQSTSQKLFIIHANRVVTTKKSNALWKIVGSRERKRKSSTRAAGIYYSWKCF